MSTLNNTVYICSNPLEQFEVIDFIYFSGLLLGAKFSLTNIGLYLIIVTFLILVMIETISYVAKALSLGLRLTANMIDNIALFFVLIIIFDSIIVMEFLLTYYPNSTISPDILKFPGLLSLFPAFMVLDEKKENNSQDSQDPQNTLNKETKVTTVITYSNSEVDRSQILSDNKGRAGIYMWTHNESGKRYIGSAVDLSKRLSQYFSLPKLKRADNYISRALLLYTHSAFSLTILEIIDISSKSVEESRKLILEREQFNLDSLGPEYNILKIAGSWLGYNHSEESIAKISLAKLGENHPMYGKTNTIEAKTKISKASRGENNPMSKKVFVYSLDLKTKEIKLYKTFNTCIEAANHFDCSSRNISRYLDKNRLYKKQWMLYSSEQ